MSKKAGGRRQRGHTFIRLSVSLAPTSAQVTPAKLLEILDAALTGMYGLIGGALIPRDLISFEEDTVSGIIRFNKSDEEKIRAATTFVTSLDGAAYRLQVLESSASLVSPSSLREDSRD